MRLPDRARLKLSFDILPLIRELDRLHQDAWRLHFVGQNFSGDWSVIPLRSAAGETHPIRMIYSDPSATDFADTPFLEQCPSIRAVLGAFACELRSVRLMRLTPGSSIKEHRDDDLDADLGMARIHVPLATNPGVAFRLNGSDVAMQSGEAWYLRLSDPHSVTNLGTTDRIHLVIDAVVNDWLREAIGCGALPDPSGTGAVGAGSRETHPPLPVPPQTKVRAVDDVLLGRRVSAQSLTWLQREMLDTEGYIVLRSVFDPAQCARLVDAFETNFTPSDQWPMPRGYDTRHSMLNDDPEAIEACLAPAILASVQHILGRRFFLSDVQGRDPRPGGGHQSLHRDWVEPDEFVPMVIGLAFLDNFGADNGATRLVPRSHRTFRGMETGTAPGREPDCVVVSGSAGDILIMNGYLLHGATRNVCGTHRRNLQISFLGHELFGRHSQQ